MQLGEVHYKCMEYIIEGYKVTEIAKKIDKSRQSIYNWLLDEDFKAELDKYKNEIKVAGTHKILSKFDSCVEKIYDLAMTSNSDNVRLNALTFIVESVVGKATSKVADVTEEVKKENKVNIDLDKMFEEIDNSNVVELKKVN